MTFKRAICASTLTAGVGLAGLFGLGLGTASADFGPDCNAPGRPPCGQDQHWNNQGPDNHWNQGQDNRWNQGPGNNFGGPGPVDWHGRGIDQGRFDHQPFNWNGQQVNPMLGADGQSWGFWFLGMWIPL
jgi:hypothetical protein